ncbi:MAG: hypothetical protein HRU15_14085, partial [Planctomycetes bacterium]|nr:hypothetical protein [Planctomycetota bacterium]
MAQNVHPTPCGRCQAPILSEDFEQGLAVRVLGQPICKICVDAGVTVSDQIVQTQQDKQEQREHIQNQHVLRFSCIKNPNLNRFTFLTAGHVTLHRRTVRDQKNFNPPELEAKHETDVFKKSDRKRDHRKRSSDDVITARSHERRQRPAPTKGSPKVVIAAICTTLVLVIGVLAMSGGGNEQAALQDNSRNHTDAADRSQQDSVAKKTPVQNEQKAKPKGRTYRRSDFARSPLTAWRRASQVLVAKHEILQGIAGEVRLHVASTFRTINSLIDQGEFDLAKKKIVALKILHAQDDSFAPLHKLYGEIKKRCQEGIAHAKSEAENSAKTLVVHKNEEEKTALATVTVEKTETPETASSTEQTTE